MESGIEAGEELNRAAKHNDFAAGRFAAFERRSKLRYESFRRFVIAFYSPEFRDLFFHDNPPKRMFRAVVTVLAGNWRPTLWNRMQIALFFRYVAMQRRVNLAPQLHRRDAAAGYPS